MRACLWLFLVGLSLFPASVLTAQQAPAKPVAQSPAGRPAARSVAAQPPFRPFATVQQIMKAMAAPSGALFRAVSSELTANGIVEKAPKTDEEWEVVRNNALIVMEAANLLMIGGRRIASVSGTSAAARDNGPTSTSLQIVLTPAEIEARVAKDRANWIKMAQALIDAGLVALKGVDARDAEGVSAAGDTINLACENCHLRYWYSEEKRP